MAKVKQSTSKNHTKKTPSRLAEECDSKRVAFVSLYRLKLSSSSNGRNIKLYNVIFLLLYLYQAYWCVSTAGKPYRTFLEKADREGFQVMEGTTKMRAELEYALSDINNPDRPPEKVGWFAWMSMDIEEHAALKKREKEQSVLDSLPKNLRVPKRYAPAFTPMLVLGILATLHLLVILMQHWSVGFNVWLNYKEIAANGLELPEELLELPDSLLSDEQDEGTHRKNVDNIAFNRANNNNINREGPISVPSYLPTHARITPSAASESDVLVPLLYLPTLGMTFEYHRRRYAYNPDSNVWSKIRCRTTMPTSFFTAWTGLKSQKVIVASQIRFGQNVFDVRQPTFKELYKAQLLSPFTVFQLFCVVLWMLDEYWQYSAFTLFMILTFEATVVFTRIKSLGALRGMGNKPRPVLVYRMERWSTVESCDLLPGDIMSLTRHKPHYAVKNDDASNDYQKKKAVKKPTAREDEDGDVVPADVVLLRGLTVVNEASLTGESVPQMKEGLSEIVEDEELSMKNRHKTHVLYAGTRLLQCKGIDAAEAEEESLDEDETGVENNDSVEEKKGQKSLYEFIPNPPDGGCLCFVLRTGFSSAQGKLVRMIEGSQEKVKGHEKETALLLLLLFVFALASSSYVLYHGLRDENRSQYELLLHCILIITSVIPPELPMQMALAVNNSLMTLMKMQVFCTEPYRVPIAGKLDCCLFDKTGTLTTDELVAVGVCESKSLLAKATADDKLLTPMTKIANEAALVLAGCHSLISIEGETTGDPLECASLNAMRWHISKETGNAVPNPATEKKPAGKTIAVFGSTITELEILARHHFSSKLQRMSCVVREAKCRRIYAVAKGSPEAIGKLLTTVPSGYESAAKSLAKRGYRVIAMAFKLLSSQQEVENSKKTRASCEKDIVFAGFIAFTCRVRKDTKLVLRRLMDGGMSVAMVTGDALLTAAHVAKEVGICDSGKVDEIDPELNLEKSDELKELLIRKQAIKKEKGAAAKSKKVHKTILILEQDRSGMMFWQSYDDESKVADFVASKVPELAKKYDLATTGKSMAEAFEFDEESKNMLEHFKIFARMSPDAKETVIECLHSVGNLCLMCGDGANDVGALKQADVGVALLSGFGDVNVDKGEDGIKREKKELPPAVQSTAIMTQDQVQALKMMPVSIIKAKIRQLGVEPDKYPDLVEKDDLVKLYQIKARERAVVMHDQKNAMDKSKMTKAELKAEQRTAMAEKQRKLQIRIQELEAQGEKWASVKAMKEFYAAEMEASKKVKAQLASNHSIEGSAATLAAQFEDLELDEIPMVKIGDASIAAPFTSKIPSIRSCVDIIRQGRCTLVTSIQMYQILALNCLISAYSLSVLYLDGVKYGDVQMTAMGMLMSVSFMSVSRSKPLDKLSSVRPLTSIFHPSLFISLLGQFAVHLVSMMWAVRIAKGYLPVDHKVDLDGEFKPGIVNTVVFLVSNVQHVTVFIVNLQGRPFMTGLTENRPLLWSLIATFILTFMFASESVPGLNKYFQIVPFPDDAFRDFILRILVADVVVSLAFDRTMKLIFCPKILIASVEGTTLSDVLRLARTIGIILAVMYIFLGNDQQWDELLRDEGRLDELSNTTSNTTEGMLDSVTAAAKVCVGAICGDGGLTTSEEL